MTKVKNPIYIKILGTGVHERIEAASHEIVGMPADTFHKITLMNGALVYYSSFGIRSIVIADSPVDLD